MALPRNSSSRTTSRPSKFRDRGHRAGAASHRASRRRADWQNRCFALERLEERCLLAGPSDMTPPRIIDVDAVTDARGRTIVAVTLDASESLAAAAGNKANYSVRLPGRDKRLGTADDLVAAPRNAAYAAATNRVTLTLAVPQKLGAFFQIVASGAVGAITDEAGNRLDGNADGTEGDNFAVNLALGANLKYTDADGDAVSLKLTGGDFIEFVQTPQDSAPRLEIVNRVPGSSALTGSVKRPRVGGDGKTQFASITGDAIANRLPAASFSIIPDTTPPAAPTGVGLLPASDSGVSNSDRITNDATPTIFGTAEVGAVVRLFSDATQAGQTTATAGTWQITPGAPGLADGPHTFTATATDAAGNTSAASAAFAVTIDTTAPDSPAFDLDAASDTLPVGDHGTKLASVTLVGQTTPNMTVELLPGAATTTSDAAGRFEFASVSLASGPNVFTVRATDVAGNQSTFPRTIARLDTPPALPMFDLDAASDAAPLGDGVTTFATVKLVGQTSADTMVELLPAGISTSSDAQGRFEFAGVSLMLGANSFTVRATDDAGKQSTFDRTIRRVNGFILDEGTNLAEEVTQTVGLGQPTGSRTLSFDVGTAFDTSDQTAAAEDTLLVYLVDPANPTRTLLDRGEAGTALFALHGSMAEFTPGQVRFNGKHVDIDVTSLGSRTTGLLRFQLINSDADTGTEVTISEIASVVDAQGSAAPTLLDSEVPASSGGVLDLANLTATASVMLTVENARLDTATGRYTALLRVRNDGAAIGRRVAVVFDGLPASVQFVGPSGSDAAGRPYVNFTTAVPRGGLATREVSSAIKVSFDDPSLAQFALRPTVLVAGPNQPPVLDPVGPLSVRPGGHLEVPLVATDPDGDRVTLSIRINPGSPALPTGMLRADGTLVFAPKPDEVAQYTFDVLATDGAATVSRTVTLIVTADPATTTRVSGFVLDVDGTPLSGMQVEIGAVQGLTLADGSFTLDLGSGPVVSDTLKVRGETFPGPLVYPFIGEKVPLLLEHDVFQGVNNVISRPIFLPPLDVAHGTQIDPGQNTTVRQEVVPGEFAEVFVAAGTLMNQQGTPFTGVLSITEVPPNLTPAALPNELFPDLVVTIQPGEMVFAAPAPLSMPNRAGYSPGTLMDLWSINPVTGQFDIVGAGQVSADGSVINTINGGIRNSSWHMFIPPPPPPRPLKKFLVNQKRGCAANFDCGEATSEVELHSGAIVETHDLVPYQSLGVVRGLTLTYHSQRADQRPIVHFGYENAAADPNLRLVAKLSFRRGGFVQEVPGAAGEQFGLSGGEHFWSLLPGSSSEAAVQGDLRALPSGRYDYELTSGLLRFTNQVFTGSTTVQRDTLVHINSIGSPFGNGWGLAGLVELVENPDGSALLIVGDGSELIFEPPAAAGNPFVAPPGDFSTLERLVDGTFRRTMTDQTVYTFQALEGLTSPARLISMRDRNGNEVRHAYDAAGTLTKITDPVGLETIFSTTGGRITAITDPTGRITRLDYDAAGNLTRVTDPDGSQRTWDYENDRHIIAEVDQRGNREETSYHFSGRAIGGVRKDGSVLQFTPVQIQNLYRPEATIDPVQSPAAFPLGSADATYADGNGNVKRTTVDQAGQYVGSFDGVGPMSSVIRDSRNLVISQTDARGNLTAFRYDGRGNLLNIRDTITAPAVYVLTTGGLIEPPVYAALREAGFLPTEGVRRDEWDGTQADLSLFDAVLMLSPGFGEMPDAGETALVNYVNAGGALVTGERLAIEFGFGQFPILQAIIPATSNSVLLPSQPTYSRAVDDPIVGAGLPEIINFAQPSGVFFEESKLDAKPGATTFYTSITGGAGVVGWDVGAGRVLSISTSIYFQVSDSNYRQLLGNAIEWAAKDTATSYSNFTYDPVFSQPTSHIDGAGRQTLTDVDPANGNARSVTHVVGAFGGPDDVVTTFTYTPRDSSIR